MTLPEPRITHYARWLQETRGLDFDPTTTAGYDAFWRWSTGDLGAFWQSIWDYFELQSPTAHATVLADEAMPGARWFPGAQVNYTQHVFGHAARRTPPAIRRSCSRTKLCANAASSSRSPGRNSSASVGALAARAEGRWASSPATGSARSCRTRRRRSWPSSPWPASGAIWSMCSPDMGPVAVLDRFRQIEPKVLIACDGYTYGGVAHDRRAVVAQLLDALPSVRDAVLLRYLDPRADDGALRAPAAAGARLREPAAPAPQRWSRPGCRSTIRCGSSIPAAPPDCRSRSSTATAG